MGEDYHMVDRASHSLSTVQLDVFLRGLRHEKPALPFEPTAWEAQAEAVLGSNAWGYVHGNAGLGQSYDNNRKAFNKWAFIPRRLISAPLPDLGVKLFGREYASPLAIAPVGVQRIFNEEGELATARACAKEHVPFLLSTGASVGIEAAAEANGNGHRWFQLYWPDNKHNHFTASLLSRAKNNGYEVLVVTLDTFALGWRAREMDNGYSPFLRPDSIGVATGFTDPLFRKTFKETYGKDIEDDQGKAAHEWINIFMPGRSHAWEDLAFLKDHWDGPIVLKGIQSVKDARLAGEHGMHGIVVSNHGGRQCDGGVASLDSLPEIVAAVGDKLEVLFDSGIRCGADIAKALALGAKMVLIGRPFVWGLAMAGEDGVRHVLRALLGDLTMTLHLTGIPSVKQKDLNTSILRRQC
ncbi:hypothetical protein PV08_05852 [Exophiala spinifera]|uniref:FMN hydroxy acid dehydrogenase domain-containing protein n=1 Tax=Exophiala spinifera TaxID=91928 RepID=A0A0D1ZSJ3_9EURO|nr:uncharacterized protein PV08_05852 [Exophiala spinifera]KIW15802.1 hypothetical protein PV08_05852 [Exophiala spinifera]